MTFEVNTQGEFKGSMDKGRKKMQKDHRQRSNQFKKTRICPFGDDCLRYPNCNYAHSLQELKKPVSLNKTKMCADFLKNNYCKQGTTCSFAHGYHELCSTVSFFKMKICPKFVNMQCHAGLYCRHAHSHDEIPLAQQWIDCGLLNAHDGSIKHKDFAALYEAQLSNPNATPATLAKALHDMRKADNPLEYNPSSFSSIPHFQHNDSFDYECSDTVPPMPWNIGSMTGLESQPFPIVSRGSSMGAPDQPIISREYPQLYSYNSMPEIYNDFRGMSFPEIPMTSQLAPQSSFGGPHVNAYSQPRMDQGPQSKVRNDRYHMDSYRAP